MQIQKNKHAVALGKLGGIKRSKAKTEAAKEKKKATNSKTAAEKKATMGYLIANKESDKIQILDNHIAMTVAGVWGDAQALSRYLKAEFKLFSLQNNRKISVKAAASLLSKSALAINFLASISCMRVYCA